MSLRATIARRMRGGEVAPGPAPSDASDGRRVLVTGGSGFIGSHVVDALSKRGYAPVNFDRLRSPHHPDGTLETVLGEVTDADALARAMRGCEAVIHLAAMADVGDVQKDPEGAERANCRGTLAVLEAARRAGVRRVVYGSTIWVYSDCEETAVHEETLLAPPSHLYTATKLAGELYCRSYAELYGIDYTLLRFGIPYGPRARPAAVVPAFVNKALAGEPLTIAGTGEQCRRFVYVEDLAEGVVRGLAPAAANRTYNLVGDEDVSVKQIAETVRQVVGPVEIVHTEGRAGDFRGVEVCGKRAADELGWRPQTSFREGVRRYVEWHREHAAAPSSRRRLAPSPRTIATLPVALGGIVAGVLAASLARVEAFSDPAGVILALALLAVPVAVVSGLDWARDRWRATIVGAAMLTGAALASFLVPSAHHVFHEARQHVALVILVAAAATALTGVGRLRWARG